MKRILLTTFVLFYALNTFAQSADKGLFKIRVGIGAGLLTTVSNADVNNTGYALPTLWGFEIEYNTHHRVSLGLDIFSHTYNTNDTAVISIGGGGLGVDLKYYLINKEKSNAFIGTTLGGMGLMYNAYNYPDSGSIDSTREEVWSQASGVYNKVYLGYTKYFGNVFGIYTKVGFLNIPLRMKYVTVDDVEVDKIDKMPVSSWQALFRGAFFNVGLTFKLGSKKKKKAEFETDDKEDESTE